MIQQRWQWGGVAVLVLVLGLGVGWLAGATGQEKGDEKKKVKPPPGAAAKKTAPKQLTPVQALAKVVDYPGIDDPKTSLLEALDQLAKENVVTFEVSGRAFKSEMLFDVLKTHVASTPIPAMKAPLGHVLAKILSTIDVPSGAIFLVRWDLIEITTSKAARAELGLPTVDVPEGDYPPPLILVSRELSNVTLEKALEWVADASRCNVVLDPRCAKQGEAVVSARLLNVTPDTAVEILAEMAELDAVRIENVFYVTTSEKADCLRKKHAQRAKPVVKTPVKGEKPPAKP